MYRVTTAKILCFGMLLISAQAVHAADQVVRGGGSVDSSLRRVDVNAKEKNKKNVGHHEKNMAVAARSSDFRDVALRIPGGGIPADDTRQQRPAVVESQDDRSWFQMLVAGLGVALISIIRRMGNIF